MRLEQVGTEYWAEVVDGTVVSGNVPEGTVGFAYNNPMGDLYGFFRNEQLALAEEIAREDASLIVWLA
jgi:hypothetical protein